MKISFILVDYRSAQSTICYIQHICEHIKSTDDVSFVVVDNSMDEKNFKILASAFHDINEITYENRKCLKAVMSNDRTLIIYKNDKNSGYAGGNNIGVKIAVKLLNVDYVVISNNDIQCRDSYINLDIIKKEFSKKERAAIIGPQIVGKNGDVQSPIRAISLWERWIRMSIFYPFGHYFSMSASPVMKNIKEELVKVYAVSGCFFFADANKFLDIKGFDEKNFLYGEEVILSERLKQKNYEVYYTNSLSFLHNHSEIVKKYYNAKKKYRMIFNSEMYYYEKYIGCKKIQINIAKILFRIYEFKKELIELLFRGGK